MLTEWLERVGSSVPRGFSRHFILEMLKKKPHTGKELIDFAEKQSEGKWKPSPGLIYPLLGRLLDEGLIEESTGGKYKITKKGKATTDDLETINNIVKNQLDVLFRIGNIGKFVATDIQERISTLASLLTSNLAHLTKEETDRYKQFLQSELKKMEKTSHKKGKKIKID